MKKIKKAGKNLFKRIKKLILTITVLAVAAGIYGSYTLQNIEDQYYAFQNEEPVISTAYPFTTQIVNQTDSGYDMQVSLMGVFPVKNVNVQLIEEKTFILGGQPFGVKYYTDGAVIVGCTDVTTSEGKKNPAAEAGLRVQDVINEINGQTITSNEQLTQIIEDSKGQKLTVKATRNELTFYTELYPVLESATGKYKIGLWVRDSTAGIGTITYYDPQNKTFAALGHSISDIDTGQIMPLQKGEVLKSSITGIKKGTQGSPGELQGVFENEVIGTLYSNEMEGIFGDIDADFDYTGKEVQIGLKQQVTEGPATIYCTLDDSGVQEYEIQIVKINKNTQQTTKNMILEVTDERLLEKTGGIVQGMSGSPIMQNGKLIGAVTHVLIDSPTRGYGIFIENMLAH